VQPRLEPVVRGALAAVAAVLLLASGAFAQDPSPPEDPAEAPSCEPFGPFFPTIFGNNPERVDNPFLPFEPGTQRVFEGRSNVTGSTLPHRVTFTVTEMTKIVDGVRGRVMWDVDATNGVVAEAELAVFAQDKGHNVWNIGEYPEEYPGGHFVGAPNTWWHGVEDAEAGVHMPYHPSVDMPEYLQGSVPSIEFLDCAQIVETGATECLQQPVQGLGVACFDNVVVIHERSPLDPDGGIQVKYHTPDIGIFKIGAIDDPEGETLELVEFNRLAPEQLAEANRQARILDQRGLQCDAIHRQTEPLEGPSTGAIPALPCGTPLPPPPVVTGSSGAAFTAPPAPAVVPPVVTPPRPAQRPSTRARYVRTVNHPLVPLNRIRRAIYAGTEDGARIDVDMRVRSRRVRVAGVLATAVDVVDRENGRIVERSRDYYAQDADGNVWYLGERVRNIRRGRVVSREGEWLAGRDRAKRGLFMPADLEVGRTFRQTRAPGVSQDRSTIVATGVRVRTRAGMFRDCVRTRDVGRRRGAPPETKVYCPGVGLVVERQRDGTVQLVRVIRRS
jgi:hypothetical protein